MVDVHTHTFTSDHLPDRYLPWPLMPLLRVRCVRKVVAWALRNLGRRWHLLNRVRRFLTHVEGTSQQANFEALVDLHWNDPDPIDVIFRWRLREDGEGVEYLGRREPPTICVLPMDFTFAGLGRVPVSVEQQVAEACLLEYRGVRPLVFLPVDPRRSTCDHKWWDETVEPIGAWDVTKPPPDPIYLAEWVNCMCNKFPIAGLKLYPPLNFHVDDRQLDRVYELAERRNLPVVTHCGGTTVRGKGVTAECALQLMRVDEWRGVLTRFPKLRIDLAHSGGEPAWRTTEFCSKAHWEAWNLLYPILALLDEFPDRVFIDTAYVAFADATRERYVEWLSRCDQINQILFGTDAPLIDIERGNVRHEITDLRERLGEDRWLQITETNPRRFLFGEGE